MLFRSIITGKDKPTTYMLSTNKNVDHPEQDFSIRLKSGSDQFMVVKIIDFRDQSIFGSAVLIKNLGSTVIVKKKLFYYTENLVRRFFLSSLK